MNRYEQAIFNMCDADSHNVVMGRTDNSDFLNYRRCTIEGILEFYRLAQLENKSN